MSTTRRPGYFDLVTDEEIERAIVTVRLDRLSDLAECEHLSDDARELLRWAAHELSVALLPDTR